jgi:hypothetical protein
MATKAPNTNFADEPSIIIDPSLYVPEEKRWLLQTVCETFIDVTRVLVAVTFSGTAAFSGAQLVMEHQFSLEDRTSPGVLALVPNDQRAPATPSARASAGRRVSMDLKLAAGAPVVSVPCGARGPEAVALCVPTAPPTTPVAATPRSKPARAAIDVAAGVRAARRMLALNRLDEAEAAYRKVLVVDEHQPAALTGLARIHLARGERDEALILAQRAVEIAPDQASGQLALGDALRAKGVQSAPALQAQADTTSPAGQQQVAASDAQPPQSL